MKTFWIVFYESSTSMIDPLVFRGEFDYEGEDLAINIQETLNSSQLITSFYQSATHNILLDRAQLNSTHNPLRASLCVSGRLLLLALWPERLNQRLFNYMTILKAINYVHLLKYRTWGLHRGSFVNLSVLPTLGRTFRPQDLFKSHKSCV